MLALKIAFWTLLVVFIGYILLTVYCGIINRRNRKAMSYISKFINYTISLITLDNDLSDDDYNTERYYQLNYANGKHIIAYLYFAHIGNRNKLEIYSTSKDLKLHCNPLMCVLDKELYAYLNNKPFSLSKYKITQDNVSEYNFLLKVLGKAFGLACKCISHNFDIVRLQRINFFELKEVIK